MSECIPFSWHWQYSYRGQKIRVMFQNGALPILGRTVPSECECGVSTSDIWYGWEWLGLWRHRLNQI